MGLTAYLLSELVELKRRDAIPGRRVIEIGAHQLSNLFLRADADLVEIYRLCGATRITLGSEADAGGAPETILPTSPPSAAFWRSLGFAYTALEYGGRHGVTAFDLNHDPLPAAMRGAFDLLVNAGTAEHVFDQRNTFAVMHDLMTVGGVMMHTGPAGGFLTHGLYQYSLKFFWHLCRDNDYEILRLQLIPWRALPMPANVIESNARWGSSHYPPLPPQILEIGYMAVLRKRHDRPFQVALDL